MEQTQIREAVQLEIASSWQGRMPGSRFSITTNCLLSQSGIPARVVAHIGFSGADPQDVYAWADELARFLKWEYSVDVVINTKLEGGMHGF